MLYCVEHNPLLCRGFLNLLNFHVEAMAIVCFRPAGRTEKKRASSSSSLPVSDSLQKVVLRQSRFVFTAGSGSVQEVIDSCFTLLHCPSHGQEGRSDEESGPVQGG